MFDQVFQGNSILSKGSKIEKQKQFQQRGLINSICPKHPPLKMRPPRTFEKVSELCIVLKSIIRTSDEIGWPIAFGRIFFYLPPAGDINLHHVCACVRGCVRACVRVSRSFLKDYYS